MHAFCLYCGEEYEDERMLSTRCGPQHIRNQSQIPADDFEKVLQSDESKNKAQEEVETKEGEVNEKDAA